MRINKRQEIALWVAGLIWCVFLFLLAGSYERAAPYLTAILSILTVLTLFSLRDRK